MLALFEIELEALNDGEIPQTHGHMVHGHFFRTLKQTAPDLCNRIHGMNGTLPFTLSTLYKCGAHPGIHTPEAEKGKRVCYRAGLLNDELVTAVSLAINKAMITGPVVIADIPFGIKAIRLLKGEEIHELKRYAAVAADRLRTFEINFRTLSCFRSEGRSLLFPETRLVISSLYRSWTAAGGHEIPDETLRRIARNVFPARYSLRTGMLDMGKYLLSGFVGYCSYEVDECLDRDERSALLSLLGMIPYAGIGYKTTMGMGQARYRIVPVKDPYDGVDEVADQASTDGSL